MAYVLAVARSGTLLGASKTLGVAHTTVGRRLRTLESSLGVRLFDRTPDGLVATAAGEDLAAVAQRMEDDVLSVQGRVLGRDAQLRGELRVATFDTLFIACAEVFRSFMERYPSIELSIAFSPDLVSLTRREADVVVRLSNAPPEHLHGRKLGFVQFAAYASSSLVERVGRDAPLGAYPWIGWSGGPNLRWFEGWLAEQGGSAVMKLGDRGALMARAVRAGIGAQILPCALGDADPELERIAALDELFRLDLWLLTLPELRTNSRVRAFMDHMPLALAKHRALLTGCEF